MSKCELHLGDCREVLKAYTDDHFDSVVTDPPYEIGLMGKGWDKAGVAFDPKTWQEVLRVLKPGGYMLSFGGSRTYHRLTCAIEDAGFEIRDCLMWLYGTGFPKGVTTLKPAYEPIVLARKPGPKVLPLRVDECRVPTNENPSGKRRRSANVSECGVNDPNRWVDRRSVETFQKERPGEALGRYPANVLHDGSDDVGYNLGGNARFFYCAKASKSERGEGNNHPTVKPLELIKWCVRLITPPNGKLLDPFAGSGTTLLAASTQGFSSVGIEKDTEYFEILKKRAGQV